MTFGQWLNGGLDLGLAIAMPIVVLSLFVSLVVVAAGWRARRNLQLHPIRRKPTNRFELGLTPFASGLLDVAAEFGAVLRQCEGLAAGNLVALELAVEPDLAVRADSRVFRDIVAELVAHAIRQAPCGRVLLGAARYGGRVQVTVSDDGDGADHTTQVGGLRAAERLAALQGATMEVDARAGQGTTVMVRLPIAGTARRGATQSASTDPAAIWTAPGLAAYQPNSAAR